MMWKAFISFNDSCLLFRSSIELLTPRLSPWVSCTEDLILCRTSGQTVTIYSFPLRFFLPSRDPSIFLEKLRFLCLDTLKLAYKPWLPFVFASDFSVSERDWNTPFRAWYITSRCLNIGWNTPLLSGILLLGVWISDETLLLVLAILHLGGWISSPSWHLKVRNWG